MATLFEIGDELRALDALLDEVQGDISDPEAERAIEDWFAELGNTEAAKLDGYLLLMRQWEMESIAAKAEAERFATAAKVRENRIERLKGRLLNHLIGTNRTKVQTAAGRTIRMQKNGTKPLVFDIDATVDNVPEQFVRVRKELDKAAVGKAITAGEDIQFARFEEAGFHLRIA